MPHYSHMLSNLNTAFNHSNINDPEFKITVLSQPDLRTAAREVNAAAGLPDAEEGYAFLDKIPPVMQATLWGMICSNLKRKEPLPTVFTWELSAGYELHMFEMHSTGRSPGHISVRLRCPYP